MLDENTCNYISMTQQMIYWPTLKIFFQKSKFYQVIMIAILCWIQKYH